MGNHCNKKSKGDKNDKKKDKLNVNISDKIGATKSDAKLDAKIVLIGSSGVGKTSIALRYKEGKFNDNPKATVGASYF